LVKGIFENVPFKFFGLIKVIVNSAFIAGSSKHGKALLACVGSNLVVAKLFLNKNKNQHGNN
jgi:hypothetical protein